MRTLITGAKGFVGKHLARHLLECGDEVLGADLQAGKVDLGGGRSFSCEALNIVDTAQCAQLITSYRPEVIYHLAGIAFVPEAEGDFSKALQVNVVGTNNIVRPCHLLRLGTTVLFVSSAEVYGKVPENLLPISEQTPLQPNNNYSLSKLMAELVVERYCRTGYVRSVVVRPFNHIGPCQDNRFVVSSFAYQLAQIAQGKVEPVLQVGNLEARRDFTDVRDIVRAYRLAVQHGQGVYNLCSGQAVAIQQILDMLIKISGLQVNITKDPARLRPSEVARVCGNSSKAERELGWQREFSLEATLRAVYEDWLTR